MIFFFICSGQGFKSYSKHVKHQLFSDMNKHNIIITRSNRPMKQFQQCVSSLDSVTLLKIDFKVTPKFQLQNSALRYDSRLHSILYTMPVRIPYKPTEVISQYKQY